jgi:hypothetical protein
MRLQNDVEYISHTLILESMLVDSELLHSAKDDPIPEAPNFINVA